MNAPLGRVDDPTIDRAGVEAFVFAEARLQDESQYEQWEALWTDDAIYWVPANGENSDPERQVSVIYDNRARISGRIRQLMTGRRHAQLPVSRMRRVISNFEYEAGDESEIRVSCNFILAESRRGVERLWAGRTKYVLRRVGDELKMARKTVVLIGNDAPMDTLAFLI